MINLEFLFVWLVRADHSSGFWCCSLGGHVKDLKHCIVVEVLKVDRLQDNLADNEVSKFFFQLNFIEELNQVSLANSSFTISLSI